MKTYNIFYRRLYKAASSFGDTRNALLYAKKHKVTVGRKPRDFTDFFSPDGTFDNKKKHIYIPRKSDNINIKPRFSLLHELSHAVHYNKKSETSSNIPQEKKSPLKILKEERIANSNALNFISDKKDRKSYIEHSKNIYDNRNTTGLNKKHYVR